MLPSNNEEENYNCMMKIMNVPVCEGFRKIFKQEWDRIYKTTKGVWDDSCISGSELYNMEKTRRHAKQYLRLFSAGKTNEWDCSALFDAILYSNAIGKHLSPHVSNKVDELRKMRNCLVHSFGPQHKMSDADLKDVIKRIKGCFNVLKLSTEGVERIINSSKRNCVKWKFIVVFLVPILSATIYWVTKPLEGIPTFRVLPTQPVHLIANRSRTVDAILQDLRNLSVRNNRSLTYMYISGNPGSGKSQLARLVGQRFETIIPDNSLGTNTFVMTLNGRSLNDIYDSYVDFARRIDYSENEIASIVNSNKTTTATKIKSIKTKIAKKLTNYKNKHTWLLIIDNVLKLSEIFFALPKFNDEDWIGGQVLITTQDKPAVPPNSSSIVHISVSHGMDLAESCEFLTSLSGLVDSQDSVSKVAKKLDYQPLALASAAFYVKQLRESKLFPDFSWNDYLQKLNEGKRNLTETKLGEVNHAYSLTMSTAVLLAVTKFAESDPVLQHAFTFLSYVSYEPQSLEVVVSYILRIDKERDKEDVGLKIRQCSLVLPSDDQKVVSISTHRVVHDMIKLYSAPNTEQNAKSQIPLNILQLLLRKKCALGEIALIPHLREFFAKTKNISSALVPHSLEVKQEMQRQIFNMTLVVSQRGEIFLSKELLILALKIATEGRIKDKVNLIHVSFPKIGEIYNSLGSVENRLGNSKQARKYFKQALKILLIQHGPFHRYVALCYCNLGGLHCSSPQECRENVKYSLQALKISDNEIIRGLSYSNIGSYHYHQGNLLKAKSYYEVAMAIFMKMLNDTNRGCRTTIMRLAKIMTNLGAVNYRLSGDYEPTKKLFKDSIELYLSVTGANHLDLGHLYYHLGVVHSRLNELREAEKCFKRALEIYNRQLHPSHEMIAVVSKELACVLERTGPSHEAAGL